MTCHMIFTVYVITNTITLSFYYSCIVVEVLLQKKVLSKDQYGGNQYIYYRPQRSCGQGNIFTPVILFTAGGVCLSACWDTPLGADTPQEQTLPREQTPPGSRTPWSRHPPQEQTPPGSRHPPGADPPGPDTPPPIWEQTLPRNRPPPGIRSMSGRYASYWNAFLFDIFFHVIL